MDKKNDLKLSMREVRAFIGGVVFLSAPLVLVLLPFHLHERLQTLAEALVGGVLPPQVGSIVGLGYVLIALLVSHKMLRAIQLVPAEAERGFEKKPKLTWGQHRAAAWIGFREFLKFKW